MGSHEALKKQKERFAGDRFIILLNSEGGHNFIFKESPQKDPPDLIYEDMQASKTLLLEITAAYYNQKQAKWEWDIDRGIDTREFPLSPSIVEPDLSLSAFLNDRIQKKCKIDFADPILLVIDLNTFATTSTDIQDFITSHLALPAKIPFQEIWLLLNEPYTSSSPSEGKYDSILDLPPQERRFRLYPKS